MRIALSLLSFFLALGIAELAARKLLVGAELAEPGGYYGRALGLVRSEGGDWLKDIEPHPYFGFATAHRADLSSNNYGFTDPRPFPYRKKSRTELVIGVLGGSVAQAWGTWIGGAGREHFLAQLRQRVPSLSGREIVTLNMAMGGYKQPQQYFVASYFQESVDLFVSVEGFNELRAASNQPVVPIEYPTAAYLHFSRGRAAESASFRIRTLASLSHALLRAGHEHPWLGRSGLFLAAARGVHDWVSLKSAEIAGAAKAAFEEELRAEGRSFYDEEGRRADPVAAAARVWERFTVQEAKLLAALGKKAVFFVQPNQYVAGSKTFTEWERSHALFSDYAFQAHGFEELPRMAARLRAQGVNAHDLTQLFQNVGETIYVDKCCHMNDLGNRLMSEAIAAKIAGTLRF